MQRKVSQEASVEKELKDKENLSKVQTPRNNNLSSGGNPFTATQLPPSPVHVVSSMRRKASYEQVRYTFKHDILSMDGFHPDYKKTNQDFARFHTFLTHKEPTKLFLLADGHGPICEVASQSSIEWVCAFLEKKMNEKSEPELTDDCIKTLLTEAFDHVQAKFKADTDHNFKHSGTTLVMFLYRKSTMYLASVGDSRGFIASKCGNYLVPSLISKDHKPDCFLE